MTPLSADSPISEFGDDLLGYTPFAEALAKGLSLRAQNEGFVVGVQAQWGMGKTSAVNLTLRSIEQLEKELNQSHRTAVQWFNPWQFSGLDALARGYLNQLGAVIASSLDKNLSRKSRKFLEGLARGGSEFIGGAAALGVVAATGGAAIPLAATVKSGVSGAVGLGSYVAESRNLDKLSAKLRSDLEGLPHKILIVLDDLDRLQPEELKQVLTLVKTFGNLPKVTHLLVYDRLILNSLLGENLNSDQSLLKVPSFLEKVVQVELDLPHPSRSGLVRLLNDKVNDIFGDAPGAEGEDGYDVWRIAQKQYLLSPRDIVRFTNSLSVMWPGIAGEVYIPDLVGIELLRHFERRTFDLVKRNTEFLTAGALVGDEERKRAAEQIVESVPIARREDTKELLRKLFPILGKYVSGWSSHSPTKPILGRRIGSPEGYDAFFRYSPDENEVRVSELFRLSENFDDETALRATFHEKMGQTRSDGTSLAASLLEELEDILSDSQTVGQPILNVLLEFGDDLIIREDTRTEFLFPVSNDRRLSRVFSKLLPKIPAATRFATIKTSIERPESGVTSSAMLVAEAAVPFQLIFESERETPVLLSEAEVYALGSLVVAKIREAEAAGTLLSKPELWMLLKIWKVFGDVENAKSWASSVISTPSTVKPLVLSTMSRVSYTSSGPKRSMDKLPDAELFDVDELLAAAKILVSQNPLIDENGDVARFITFVENNVAAASN